MDTKKYRVGIYDSHGTAEVYKYFDTNESAYECFIDSRIYNDEVWIDELTSTGEYETIETYNED